MNIQMISTLILRDFRAYRIQILGWSLFGLVVGMFMIFINTNLVRMFAGSSNLIFLAAIWPFISELKNNNTWIHTASLPVSRKAIVISRFLISLSIALINLLIWLLAFNVLKEILHSDPQYIISGKVIFYVWMDLLFHFALFYFAFYRFNLLVAIAFYFAPILLPTLLRTVFSPGAVPMSDFVIEDINLFSTGAIVALSLFILSFFTSISHFNKRDL